VAGFCGKVNEPSVPVKDREFLDYPIVLLAFQEGLCLVELLHVK
jgi:hypothetical protein